jgi:hypothetical protein
MNPYNPLSRHSGAGRNPAIEQAPQRGQSLGIDPLYGDFSINWIPALAGMTGLMDYLG